MRFAPASALDIYRRAAAELAETAVAIRCKLDFPVEVTTARRSTAPASACSAHRPVWAMRRS